RRPFREGCYDEDRGRACASTPVQNEFSAFPQQVERIRGELSHRRPLPCPSDTEAADASSLACRQAGARLVSTKLLAGSNSRLRTPPAAKRGIPRRGCRPGPPL